MHRSVHRLAPLLFAASFLSLLVSMTAQAAEPITEGVVDFDIDYDDMGPMSAMMPKTEKVFFRPDQIRIESGLTTTLRGVVPGRQVQMMNLGENKVAFLIATDDDAKENEMLRFADGEGTRTVAGMAAREVEAIDRDDETNRLSYWLTDGIVANFEAIEGIPAGFPLDFIQILGEGTAHKVATRVEEKSLEDPMFTIPDDYRRIEVDSADEITAHLQEILGQNIQVQE